MSNDPLTPPRAVPIAAVPLLLVAVLALTAIGLKVLHSERELWVLARDVGPGHLIQAADFAAKPESVSGFGLGEVVVARDELEGHVARTELSAGEPIAPDEVTAVAAPSDYPRRKLLRLRADQATMVEVRSGEEVALGFAPTGDESLPGSPVVGAVLVDADEDGDETVLLVAVLPTDVAALLSLAGRSRLIVAAR
jgi:hypothetical protein